MQNTQKITPFLWFDDQAQKAMAAMLQMKKIDISKLKQPYVASYSPHHTVD